jgi:hypothetical protein
MAHSGLGEDYIGKKVRKWQVLAIRNRKSEFNNLN